MATRAFKTWLFILLTSVVLMFASCVPSTARIYEVEGRTSNYDATLIDAYSTSKNCGHKGHYDCEVFMGKLKLDNGGGTLVREIDGFFFNKFIDNGKQPLPAYVALTKSDFGATVGLAWHLLQMLGFILSLFIIFTLLYGILELPDNIRKEKETWR